MLSLEAKPAVGPAVAAEELDVTFFVPCLNEQGRVCQTLDTLRASLVGTTLSYEILVVDDGSTDGTAAIVREYCAANPEEPITLHQNPRNLGLAHSFVDAAFRARGRFYRLICGDNIEPKESISAVVAQIGKADIIVPYYPLVPGKGRTRLLLSGLFTAIINLTSGQRLKYYNGNPLYRRYDVMRWSPHNFGFGYQADLLTQLIEQKRSYIELPILGIHQQKKGQSSIKVRNLLSVAHSIVEISLRRFRRILFES